MGELVMRYSFFVFVCLFLSFNSFAYEDDILELTLGRELTGIAGPSVTARRLLDQIAKFRGGEPKPHKDPGKWKLKAKFSMIL